MSVFLKYAYRVLGIAAVCLVLTQTLTIKSQAHLSGPPSIQEQSKLSEQLVSEADRLSSSGSPESIRRAIDLLQRALDVDRKANNSRGEASTLHRLAIAYDSLGDKERALEYFNRSLALVRQNKDRASEALVLNNIGLFYSSLSETDRALQFYQQALAIFREISDHGSEALVLNNIGRVYHARNEPQKARESYEQALSLWRKSGDRSGEANTLNNLGATYELLGDYSRALEVYSSALNILETVANRRGQATTLNNIGYLNSQRGNADAALNSYGRALEIWQALGDRNGSATTLENMASVYDARGDKQKSSELIAQASALRAGLRAERKPVLHILAIGNDHYPFGPRRTRPDMKYPIWNLTTAVNDARELSQALETAGRGGFERVSTNLVINAKRVEILGAFDKVIHEIKPEDTFIFSYSGQGFSAPVKGGKREFYLMPTDFSARAGIPAAISATLLRALFTKIQAQRRLIILDARDSSEGFDSLAKAIAEEDKSFAGLFQRDVALVTISEGPRVSLVQGEGSGNGLLTYSLLKAIRESGASPALTVRQLVQYAHDYVKQRLPTIPNLNDYQRHGEVRSFFAGSDFPLVYRRPESGRAYAHRVRPSVVYWPEPQQPQSPTSGIQGRSDTALARTPTIRKGRDFALLIAGNEYDQWPPLANPIPDAEAIEVELKNYYGFETKLIRNPTKSEIVTALKTYKNDMKYGEDDQLFIFIAGHGTFNDDFREGYIVAKNSLKDDTEASSYLSHSQLRNIIDQIPCRHIFLVIDACYGGTFDEKIARRGDRPNPYENATNREFIYRKMQFITRRFMTSGGKEYVPDGKPGHNSPFVRSLLEALRNYGGTSGILTINGIRSYIERTIPEPHDGEWGENQPGSDFLFVAKPK
jgi:tetratricopeptide (TPR) repeat protein/uncharacterized caspase-like protein